MIRLIASDIDGTLLSHGEKTLNPHLFDQILALKEQSILFVAASGRQYYSLQRLFAPVRDDIAYIAENGALCIYKDNVLSRGFVDRELGLEIIHAIHDYGCDCIISGKDVCYTNSPNQKFIDHLKHVVGNNVAVIPDLALITEPFLKISVCDFQGAADCETHFKQLFGGQIKITTSGNIWMDFITPDADKGIALARLLSHLQIKPSDCIAFGDQYNDSEMLQLVGTSYAMSDAAPGLSDYASDTTVSVMEVLADIIAAKRTVSD